MWQNLDFVLQKRSQNMLLHSTQIRIEHAINYDYDRPQHDIMYSYTRSRCQFQLRPAQWCIIIRAVWYTVVISFCIMIFIFIYTL